MRFGKAFGKIHTINSKIPRYSPNNHNYLVKIWLQWRMAFTYLPETKKSSKICMFSVDITEYSYIHILDFVKK